MTDQPEIRFDDGAAYERMMGIWSRKVGEVFLDWLAPGPGLDWADIGCGNGAFSELVFERAAPGHLAGIDPSEGQLSYARTRLAGRPAEFVRGDAMALPFPNRSVDVAAMALVIFFVPNPAKAVTEMVRVVRPGGLVASYGWDILGGGLPMHPIQQAFEDIGLALPVPPNPGASGLEALRTYWTDAGLRNIETKTIAVERRFTGFEEFWTIYTAGPLAQAFAPLTGAQTQKVRAGLSRRLHIEPSGEVIAHARANAIKGRVA